MIQLEQIPLPHNLAINALVTGIILLAIGLVLLFAVNSRRFNRRNAMAVQEFPNYAASAFTRFIEGIIRILSIVMIISGAAMLLRYCM